MSTQNQCRKAMNKHEDYISQLPNVVGMGVVSREEGLQHLSSKDCAVAIYVGKPTPNLPLFLPLEDDNVDVRVIVSGRMRLE